MSLSGLVVLVVISQAAPDFVDAQATATGYRALAAGGWLYQGTDRGLELVASLEGPAASLAHCSPTRAVTVGRSGAVRVVDSNIVVHRQAMAPAADLWAVASDGCDDVVFAGEGGALWQGTVAEEPGFRPVVSPTGNPIYGVAVRNGVAVAVGAGGAVAWRSARSANAWKAVPSGTEAPLLSVAFAGRAWLVAGAGGVWRGEGQQLVQVYGDPTEIFTRLVLFDERIGIALGQQAVLVTVDGGRSWSKREDHPGWLAAVPVSARIFILLGRDGRTGRLDISPEPSGPVPLFVRTDETRAAPKRALKPPVQKVGPRPAPKKQEPKPRLPKIPAPIPVKQTERMPLPKRAMAAVTADCRRAINKRGVSGPGFVDVKRAAAGLVLAGADGTIRRVVGGKPVVVATTGVPMLGSAVSADRQKVAVVGFGAMAFSVDGGKTFAVEDSPNKATFLAVAYAGDTLFAFDDKGRAFHRDQRGRWKAVAVPRAVTFYTAYFEDERHGYVVGECSTVLATEDAGASWVEIAAPMTSPQGVLAVGNVLYVTGFEGVFRSADRGRTFERMVAARGCMRLAREEDRVAVACADIGQPLWLSDGGQPFVKVKLDKVIHVLLSVAFDEGGDLVAVGPGDLLVRARGSAGRVDFDSPAVREALSRALWLFNELRREARDRPMAVVAPTRPQSR